MLRSKKSRLVAGVASIGVLGGGLAIAVAGMSQASSAPPGDNGDVKIHQSGFSTDDERNQPHVTCSFYLDGFNFDPNQSVTWFIDSWPPTGDRTQVLSGTLDMGSTGHNWTTDQTLPAGHYKLFWNFTGEHGAAKHKVFWVSGCTTSSPSPSPSPTPTPTTPAPSPSTPAPAPAPTPVKSSLPVTG
jgi:hypothetical protein